MSLESATDAVDKRPESEAGEKKSASAVLGTDLRVQDLRKAVDDTVQQLRAATFTLVSAALYLFVAGLGTSDLDLLVGRMVKLPIFEVEVSLRWFYVLAPVVLIILHFTVLNLCGLVIQRLRELRNELKGRSIDPQERRFVMGLLYPYPLVQRFTHPPESWVVRFFLTLSIYIPTVIMPVLTLFWLEWCFLAYQSAWITGLHAFYVLADLAIVGVLWARVFRREPPKRASRPSTLQPEETEAQNWRWLTGWLIADVLLTAPMIVLAIAPVGAWWLWGFESFATLKVQRDTVVGNGSPEARANLTTISREELDERLAAILEFDKQKPDYFTSVIESGFSRGGVTLRGRSLRGAILTGTSLVGADLTQADLTSADLRGADFRGAILEEGILDRAKANLAHFEGADLTNAWARGADLPYAQFQGAILHGTDFSGADLTGAHLQFVRFAGPEPRFHLALTQETIEPPKFRGAILERAQFQGTPVERIEGDSASKLKIEFRGADLRHTQMDGVNLRLFSLEGADLSEYTGLPEDEVAHAYVCGNALVLANCGSPLRKPDDKPPNFAAISYDAARVVRLETLADIGRNLKAIVDSKICRIATNTRCGTTSKPGDSVDVGVSLDKVMAPASPTAADDVATQLERLSATGGNAAEWCRSGDPRERALYMRAFVYRIYDYQCRSYLERADPPHDTVYLKRLGSAEQKVLSACGMEAAPFDGNLCLAGAPKDIPASP